jgi:hypothetical protein
MESKESTEVIPATPTAVAVPVNKPVVSDTTKLVTRMIDTVYSDGIFPSTVTPEQKHHIRTAFVATVLTKIGV